MTPEQETQAEKDDLKGAKVDHLPGDEPPLEDMPRDWADEDRRIEHRKPDLGETEDDASEL